MLTNKEVKGALLVGLAVLLAGGAQAQGLGNSPYSRLGLGEFSGNQGGVRQMGMGGVGLAAPNAVNVNELNPALLYYVGRTTFEAGYTGQYKTVQNATTANRTGSGTLGYLALAVPLSTKWAAAIGLKPLSTVDYESNVIQPVEGAPDGSLALKQYQGTGSLSEAYLAQGYHITKSLSLGATASYVFGTMDETTGTTVQPANGVASNKIVERDHTRYSDFAFRAGVHYRQKLNSKLNLNLAGVYSFTADLNGERLSNQERQDVNGAILSSIQTSDTKGYSTLPVMVQGGLSLDNGKNWSINADASHQQWSKFTSFGTRGTPLNDALRFGLGGELTPDPGSVEHYFQRVTYRVGLSVAQLPYRPNGQVLYDRAVSWGFAFPLPTATAMDATTLSLAFTYGVRGNNDVLGNGNSNVRENYIRGQFGVTLNNRWFVKRRLQ